uniref:Uncharacterized protein n=1 Tax=Romanomermis culicivorax TaxID=13658 RepID=A0A915HWZ6_ROMCU
IYLFLGCPHGCNEGIRSAQADFLRTQARSALSNLMRSESNLFNEAFVNFVEKFEMDQVLDFFHAFVGFCSAEGATSSESCAYIHVGNLGVLILGGSRLILSGFLPTLGIFDPPTMIGKIMKGLYADVRSLMNFVQENHGQPFRMVELSALVDSLRAAAGTATPSQKDKKLE